MTDNPMPLNIPIYILAGGKSSRFGNPNDDKALAEINNTPLILRLAEQLQPIANPLTIVADRADKYQHLGLNTVADHQPGLGPLAGLHRALSHHHSIEINTPDSSPPDNNWLLLLSCDLIIIKHNWVRTLRNEIHHTPTQETEPQIIAFADFNLNNQPTRIHPMPALYHQSISPVVDQHLQAHDLSMQSLIRALTSQLLPIPEDWPDIPQINTTEEYRRIVDNPPEYT